MIEPYFHDWVAFNITTCIEGFLLLNHEKMVWWKNESSQSYERLHLSGWSINAALQFHVFQINLVWKTMALFDRQMVALSLLCSLVCATTDDVWPRWIGDCCLQHWMYYQPLFKQIRTVWVLVLTDKLRMTLEYCRRIVTIFDKKIVKEQS